jgi:hypothetical protein
MTNAAPNLDALSKDELRAKWEEADSARAAWAAHEKLLREKMVERFSVEPKEDGTESVDLPDGKALKIKRTVRYELDDKTVAGSNSDASPLDIALEKIEDTIDGGKLIADRLVKFKPSLSVSEYKQLGDDAKKIIDTAVTIKPGSTSIEIVTPKR